MKGPKTLIENEGRWVTAMGKWFPGERVVMRGQDLHVDLADMDWMALYLFSITGRRFTENQLRVLNAIWTSTSFPDPRLWNNRVVALAGTARSTGVLAISAGVAVSEASAYGRRPDVRVFDFLKRAKQAVDRGIDLLEWIKKELQKYRSISGYGRPVVHSDERVQHLIRLVKLYGLDKGHYVTLALEIEKLLLEGRWRLQLNISALAAAIAADLDLTIEQFYLFVTPVFIAGMAPCFIEAREKMEGSFLPLRWDSVVYEEFKERTWNM